MSGVQDPMSWFFPNYLILPAALGPGIYSASNRNEYLKQKNKCFWGVKCGRCVGLPTLPPSMSRLSRQCGILNISEQHRPPWPVTGITLLFYWLRSKKTKVLGINTSRSHPKALRMIVERPDIFRMPLSESISKHQQLKKISATTALNIVLASAHIQMTWIVNLIELPDNRRLRRHLQNDLATRFLV
jgi:hypothetical protein